MIVLVSTFQCTSATAGIYGDALGKCLVSSTSVEDRNTLVKWLFASAASHPAVKSIAIASDTQRLELDKQIAQLVERLLTESCKSETQQAVKYEGQGVFESSFEILGKVAGRELFSSPSVSGNMSNFRKYMNQKKLESVFGSAQKLK
jgi:hypothetical protein